MDRLASFEVLVAIVDCGGFNRAAERLGMSPTMISTHLARLEDRLGVQLLHRSTRRFSLTSQGHQFVQETRGILEAIRAAENAVRRGASGPSGRVAIDAPNAIGLRFLVPAMALFRAEHPAVALDISLGDRSRNFRPDGFDILIRVGEAPQGKGEVITLGSTRFVQVASPAYLARKGTPETLDDLHDHDAVLYAPIDQAAVEWHFVRAGQRRTLRPRNVATFNHGDALATAALAGIGIVQTLEMLVAPELASGQLLPLLTEWNRDSVDLQLFIPRDRTNRAAVRAVADFLCSRVDWAAVG